jgi:hypothetical protein
MTSSFCDSLNICHCQDKSHPRIWADSLNWFKAYSFHSGSMASQFRVLTKLSPSNSSLISWLVDRNVRHHFHH